MESGYEPYTQENDIVIFDEMKKENDRYVYSIEKYRKTPDIKYFMHYNIIKIHYGIDGERYISIFVLNVTNIDDDYFTDN